MDYAFAVNALDRRVERREQHDDLIALSRTPDSAWLCVRADGAAPIALDGTLAVVAGDRIAGIPDEWIFLGYQADRPLFAMSCAMDRLDGSDDPSRRWVDLRSAAASLDAGQAGILAYARALCAWRSRHRYCGECGARNRAECGGHRLRCPACDSVTFPRTDPAIIVAVRDGDRCLLGRQAGWPAGRYSTLAGFVEPGETLEAAVAREVHEEAGIQVGDCHYVASQPWPFPASLMLGFEAQAVSTAITVGDELEDARWFGPMDLDIALAEGRFVLPPRLSISRWLIERWYRDVTGNALPVRPLAVSA